MTVPLWAADLASTFWARAGGPEPFPRRLRHHLLSTLPVELVKLPGLTLNSVLRWLRDRDAVLAFDEPDRRLCACLFAHAGAGIIFLDAGDPDDEQTFSLAHEVAHFLRHYWSVRERAAAHLDSRILEILDGKRLPRPEERLDAVLGGVILGVHTHLLPRDPGGPRGRIAEAEREADRLAWELLAPAREVLQRVRQTPGRDPYHTAAALLLTDFGFPVSQTGRYAAELFPKCQPDPLVAGLRKSLGNLSNFDLERGM